MNDFSKTAVAVVLAAGLCGAAYVTAPRSVTDAAFSDQGEVFYPAFTDPTSARSLEVIGYDEPTATITPFKVQFDGTRWVIPSHHNYPADAEANMSGAASAFIGLKKDMVVTDKASEHQALGVLAPDDDKAPLSGRGTRVTLKDGAGGLLADLIIGKAVEKTSVGGLVYARIPGKNRVYAVSFAKRITTAFSDWVQTDVLKIGSAQVSGLTVDRYEIDEQSGTKKTAEVLRISKAPPASPPGPNEHANPPAVQPRWTFTCEPGGVPTEGEQVQDAPIDDAAATLRSMKILGVRPKPEKLVRYFAGETGVGLTQFDLMGMANKGFYVTRDGQFLANEGELDVQCDDGVRYRMYFGELLVAAGEALSAGAESVGGDDAPKDSAATKSEDKAKGTEARYVLVTATFDESLLGPAPVIPVAPVPPEGYDPSAPPKPAEASSAESQPGEADKPAAPAEDTPEVAAYKAAKARYDSDLARYQTDSNTRSALIEGGKKKAENLRKNLANWYYVIDAQSYTKLRPTRSMLVKPPEPTPPGPGAGPEPHAEPLPVAPAPGE